MAISAVRRDPTLVFAGLDEKKASLKTVANLHRKILRILKHALDQLWRRAGIVVSADSLRISRIPVELTLMSVSECGHSEARYKLLFPDPTATSRTRKPLTASDSSPRLG
jgi:hypothetical protein